MRTWLIYTLSLLMLSGCIGTDVVDDPLFEARLEITPRIDSLLVGQNQQFMARFYDETGTMIDTPATWASSDLSIIDLDAQGFATCLDTGNAYIMATVGTVADTLYLNTPGQTNTTLTRMGTFVDGVAGYRASGTATLMQDMAGALTVEFGSDFSTSAGPGVYVFLGKNTTGPFDYTPGSMVMTTTSVQLSPDRLMTFSGARTFQVPATVDINDYDYVVLWCVTVNGLFGYAELN